MEIIDSSMKTRYSTDSDERVEVTALCEGIEEALTVTVKTGDTGIAAVDAFFYFLEKYGKKVRLMKTELIEEDYRELRRVGALANELLNGCLVRENKDLVACFISSCDICDISEAKDIDTAERELAELELSLNRTPSKQPICGYTLDFNKGAVLTAESIRERHRGMWYSDSMLDSVDSRELSAIVSVCDTVKKSEDAELVFYLTVLLAFREGREFKYPYTLYRKIKDGSLKDLYGSCPSLTELIEK